MAFVPKIHNREVPVANHPVASRTQQEIHGRHLRSLHEMSPRVDTRWGGIHNGTREQKAPTYTHVRNNLKRAQIQDERFAEIELENTVLLAKLSKILRRSRNPTQNTRDWTGGLRLTPNQVPVIDHWISPDPTAFGAAIEPSSLNLELRRKERERIEVENRALVARLQSCRPTYDTAKLEAEADERSRWLSSHTVPHSLSPILGSSSRPGTGNDYASTSNSFVSSQSAPGGRGGKLRPVKKGGAPRTAAGVDPAVLSVLDLLSAHMRGASSSLGEMRIARDSLMESIYPVTSAHYKVETLDAGGVQAELVCSKAALEAYLASKTPAILILVHGGMFVTGSPRAGRHLAAKLSDLVGIPVVTPTLRLAPEHAYPAALDDLKAAYNALTSMPVGGHTVKPSEVGVFAESSGGSLLLGMLNRSIGAAGSDNEPSAMVLASPWLDMTCSSNSYVANEGRDPVMQRKRLLGIARAYLPEGGVNAADPSVSPILGAPLNFLGLPPTLVQVGSAEVLVDESLEFQRLGRAVDADVSVQQYDGVLHAWHTFFPLMPKAAHALEQAAAFFCKHLGIKAPKGGPAVMSTTDAELEAAAVKLQSMQRGRLARSKPKAPKVGPTTVKWTKDYDAEAELKIAKIQAMQRGRSARKSAATAALTYGGSDLAAKKVLKEKAAAEPKKPTVGMSEEDIAATKLQAIQRGRQSRKTKKVATPSNTDREGGWNAGTGMMGFVTGDDRNNSIKVGKFSMADDDAAASRIQAGLRARQARKEAQALMSERDEAAIKLQAARRGQLARGKVQAQIAEDKAASAHAATLLQAQMRGKAARSASPS